MVGLALLPCIEFRNTVEGQLSFLKRRLQTDRNKVSINSGWKVLNFNIFNQKVTNKRRPSSFTLSSEHSGVLTADGSIVSNYTWTKTQNLNYARVLYLWRGKTENKTCVLWRCSQSYCPLLKLTHILLPCCKNKTNNSLHCCCKNTWMKL